MPPKALQKTIEEMMAELPKNELLMFKRLRALVAECLPAATEAPYYGVGVPFYKHNRMICFIWPASVFWGPKRPLESKKPRGSISLGFCQGNLMANEDGALRAEGRKQVCVMYFDTLNDINEEQVKALLFEAEMIDDSFRLRKKVSTKKK